MKIDIHNYTRNAELALKRVDKSEISECNKKHIHEFIDACVADGMSIPRIGKYTDVLRFWALWLGKDFDKANKEDIAPIVTKLQLNPKYSAWTKQVYKVMLKRFYKWLRKCEPKEYPPEVKWISARIKQCEKRLPGEGELIKEEDVQKLLNVTTQPRDRALISMLWESGCRIGELCSLCLLNIEIDKYGILITVQGKTGSRKLRLVSSTQYLSAWLNSHPFKNDKTSPLWINIDHLKIRQPIHYRGISKVLREAFRKAEIKKRCNPHLFRHSRATYLANYLTEFQMNQYFGWVQGSDMPSTYVHMSGREVDSAILALNGVKTSEKKEDGAQFKPKTCPRCDTINNYDSRYCCKCAGILDIREAMELQTRHEENTKRLNETDDLLYRLSKNPEIIKMLAQKMQELSGTSTIAKV